MSVDVVNLSSSPINLLLNNSPLVSLAVSINGDDYTVSNIKSGDVLTINGKSGSVDLKADQLLKDKKIIIVIDNANNEYRDVSSQQPLGLNTTVAYIDNDHRLFMSFSPPYFVNVTGSNPGVIQQYDGSKYVVSDSSSTSSAVSRHFYLWFFIIIILLAILGGIGAMILIHRRSHS